MKMKIESRITGHVVLFRMTCPACGRIGIYHRDLEIAERIAELHKTHAHGDAA
jgi:hypothetical protein